MVAERTKWKISSRKEKRHVISRAKENSGDSDAGYQFVRY